MTREVEVPKLETAKADDSSRWKRHIKWWERLSKVLPQNIGLHTILNAKSDPEVHEVATNIRWEGAEAEDGVDNLSSRR